MTDSAELGEFAQHHREALVRAVMAATSLTRPDAEDVVHDVLFRAVERGLPTTETEDTFRWLRHAGRNRGRDLLRGRARRAHPVPVERLLDDASFADWADPAELLVRDERRRAVRAALLTLPEHYREVLVRRHVDGQPPRDIAADLGMPVTAVKSRLQRAAAELARACRRVGLGVIVGARLLRRGSARTVGTVAPALALALLVIEALPLRQPPATGPRHPVQAGGRALHPVETPAVPGPAPDAAVASRPRTQVRRTSAPRPSPSPSYQPLFDDVTVPLPDHPLRSGKRTEYSVEFDLLGEPLRVWVTIQGGNKPGALCTVVRCDYRTLPPSG